MTGKRVFIVFLFVTCGFTSLFGQDPGLATFEPFDPMVASFPASVPVEIQEKIINAGKQPASVFRAPRTMVAPFFTPQSSAYYLLDSVQNYTSAGTTLGNVVANPSAYVGLPWMPMDDYPDSFSPNPVVSRGLVASPFGANTQGTSAIWQSAVGTTYATCNERRIGKTFALGGLNGPNAKLGFYLSINRYCSSCYYDTAGAGVVLYRGNSAVGYWVIGNGGGWIIPNGWFTTTLPNGFNGFVELPLNFGGQFDKITVFAINYNCVGNNYTYLDEIYFKPDLPLQISSVTAIPETLWVDNAGAGSGILFKAITSEPSEPQTVTFTVTGPGGTFPLGPRNVIELSPGVWGAKAAWWGQAGNGTPVLPGQYTITAQSGTSSKSSPFTVTKVDAYVINMGRWLAGKDPQTIVPKDPEATLCPTKTWDQAVSERDDYFTSLSANDPVNIVSGNYTFIENDLQLKARDSLALARIYNSLDHAVTAFGRGWSSPYLSRLEFVASDVLFINSDGSRQLFKKTGNLFVGPKETDLKLALATDTGYWSLRHPYGSEWTFDSAGKIIRMVKACCGRGAADEVSIEYDGNGHLRRVTNPAGQWFEFTTNPAGQITQVIDSAGRVLHYSFSSNGDLLSFTDQAGRVSTYAYSDEDFLTRIQKPGNRITTITYVDRRVSSITAPDGGVSRFAWDFATNKMTLTDPTGVAHEYRFDSNWRFTTYSVPSLGLTKVLTSSGSAVIGFQNSLGGNQSFTFNTAGLLEARTDALGNTSHFEYHPEFHQLTRKVDPLGREWRYTWCSRGNLQTETDPAGGVASFTFDSHNNRLSKTDQLGRVQRWVYEPSGNFLVQAIDAQGGVSSFTHDARGNLTSSTDQLGRTTTFQFDLLDRLTKTVYPDGRFVEIGYDDAGNAAFRRDNLARETRFSYDLANRLVSTTRPDGTTFTSAYNAAGQKISETDPLNRVTRFEYSPVGLLTKTIYPDGSFETMAYDTESRLISRTNELGQTTNLEWDAMGRLLATIDPTGASWESAFDAAGRKISDKDPLNRVTSYQLDNLDRITKVIRPDGSFETNVFDSVGNLLSTVNSLGNAYSWVYDNLNRQVLAIQPNGASSTTAFDAAGQVISETDPLNRTTRFSFDLGGRRTATTDALGNIWRNVYDSAGRLTSTITPLGAVSAMAYSIMDRVIGQKDPLNNVTSFEFDNAGRRVAKVDAQGRRSITAYDLRDRVTTEADPEGRTVSFGYNLAGQRVRLTDGANRTWRWEFDSLGRVIAEIGPLGDTIRSGYNAVGNRVSRTNARGELTAFFFDSMNRLVREQYPNGSLATFSFDLEGRELSRSDVNGQVTKAWDSVGNMVSETFGPWEKKWSFSFDLAGNRTQAVNPEGEVTKYRFDPLNRLVLLEPPGEDNEITYQFDSVGRMTGETRPGVVTAQTFDSADRLLELRHQRSHGSAKTVAMRRYTYSPVGNRLSMLDDEGGTTAFKYDNSDWLTGVVYPDGKRVSYGYNDAGDRLSEQVGSSATIVYSIDLGGRMVARASDSFQYDLDGNLTRAVEGGEESRYSWTTDNRLARVEKDLPCDKHGKRKCNQCQPQTLAEDYGYLPNDWRRVSRKADGQTFVSIYDQDDESGEYLLKTGRDRDDDDRGKKDHDKDDNKPRLKLLREFIGGPGTDDLEITKYHGRALEMLKDALGSIIALSNKGGNPVAKIAYDAWGNLKWLDKPGQGIKPCKEDDLDDYLDRFEGGRSFENSGFDPYHLARHHGALLSPYLFAGRRLEPFTGQYNNRWREYAPKHGRFTSSDPLGFDAGNNLYVYGNNNSVLFTDPFGLEIPYAINQLKRFRYTNLALLLEKEFTKQLGATDWPFVLDIFRDQIRNHVDVRVQKLYKEIINWGAQRKHTGTVKDNRSVITVDPLGLVDNVTGVFNIPAAPKERVPYGRIIGKFKNEAGCCQDTEKGIVHFGRAGIHIVPAEP